MRIVIDLQGAQSASRHRGIGRYSLALAQAMVRNRGEHEIIIALNGLFPDTIEPIRAEFEGILPQDNIRVWHTLDELCGVHPHNIRRRKVSELIRESFLASLQPDIIYITSLFEGWGWGGGDAITTVGLLTQTIPTVVTLYDLIPFINRTTYLGNPVVESWYENKLDQIRRADLLLAISESSRQEGIDYLGFSQDQVINVGTAADSQFKHIDISSETECSVRKRYGLLHPFILYTGGIDYRKNIEGLIRAYALLPLALRKKHQLAIVCSVQPANRDILAELAQQQGLSPDEMILTGFVPEEDLIVLYNLCKAFIFPSWHEGFGLPALEAMSCGAPVIAANTSSLPEVIGKDEALFNPFDDKEIAEKIEQVLSDDAYRAELIQHGFAQAKKFSWEKSAKVAITAFEKLYVDISKSSQISFLFKPRPKLAYISPLPPERSGISDYSAELLPVLARHYDIDVIVAQQYISDPWINENCAVRTVEWFTNHADRYERVLYHFGNSAYHQHMFELLGKIPGIVVLHDFFLGNIVTYMGGLNEGKTYPDFLHKTLYQSHGYQALVERYHAKNFDWLWKYPCNKVIVEDSIGVIVHSNKPRQLAEQWLGKTCANNWSVIPLLRTPQVAIKRVEARSLLGLDTNDFIVCSFGIMGEPKQNHRLLHAWFASTLSKDKSCHLVFVGGNDEGPYGAWLIDMIRDHGLEDRISITGWTDMVQFRHYLSAADVGVQLRSLSRGETSASVLDCMNYGLPTIVNANGSMAELPDDAVWMLPDKFDDAHLVEALETLWSDNNKRCALGTRARALVMTQHAPRICADQYAQVIENYYKHAKSNKDSLIKAIANVEGEADENEWLAVAKAIALNRHSSTDKQLLLDISELVQRDARSGIQRVVRSVLSALLTNPPKGFRVEPVYAIDGEKGYRYARQFTCSFLNCPDYILADEIVDVFNGDIFLGLDLQPHLVPQQVDFYNYLKRVGGEVYFVVYDLLPVLLPKVFIQVAYSLYTGWLNTISQADGVLCISRAVADDMVGWLNIFAHQKRVRPLKIGWFHLGADMVESEPTTGLPNDVDYVLKTLSSRPTFLMVGTIEPRKRHMQTLLAFNQLWAQGVDVNLVMVGHRGWMVEELTDLIYDHCEYNQRLFWLEGISDEYLEKVYDFSACLIAASEGEGFGLPLIEAAQHKLSIIARDIPVFREVAGTHAFYFSGLGAEPLADAVRGWLALDEIGQAPQSETMPWLTWKQSTQNLLDVILGNQWYQHWVLPDDVYRFPGGDSRLGTQIGKRDRIHIMCTGQAGYLIYGPYISLVAGKYLVNIRGTVKERGLAGAHMDVATDKGSVILGQSVLNNPDDFGNFVSLVIYLDKHCTDLEVRVWVSEKSDLKVSMIEIAPWHDDLEIGNTDSQLGEVVKIDMIVNNPETEALIPIEINKSAKITNVGQPPALKNRKNKKTQHNKRR
ncbi:glycosyltransferase [Methylobacter psychrophilus]|uniref:glycosyltransferase n=1 Tax=Methylobacter psychrophilus TaxID=96941 RepID=UPI0021D4B727|nr:glycosyltransferase [Methylobacter psychrophilus]